MVQPALTEEIYAQPLPEIFPDRLRQACAGRRIQYRLPSSVRERMQVPENIDAAEWADKYRRVTAIDAHPGKWRNELVPHAVKAMQLASKPGVKELWLCWPERAAKTNVILNAAMRQIDRGIDSGNIFWLMPNEHEAKKAIGERVIEALKATPRTARLLSRYADDTTRTLIRFRHGPRLFAAWAGSAASVSSFYGRLCIADEIDKCETTGVGKETDILTLLKKRGRDRDDSRFLIVSTPAQGYVYKGTMGCAQVWEYRPKCPHCHDFVKLSSENIVIPDGATAEDVKHGKHLLAIACSGCGAEWSDHDRLVAYHDGGWVCIKGDDIEDPETVGMHLSAYPLPNIPLKEIAEKIIAAREGGITEKRALANGYDCTDHEEAPVGQIDEAHLLKFRSELPRNLVPPETAMLVLLVDTQQASFYYELWAFGYAPTVSMHMVRHGIVETFQDIEGMLADVYEDHDGKRFRIARGLIDSGGTKRGWEKHSRTVEVYEWCSRNRIMMPHKGVHGTTGDMISYKDVQTLPGTNRKITGGLKRANIRVDVFKDELQRRLGLEPDDPGALSFHDGIDEAFARHFTSEYKGDSGEWVHDRKMGRNDYFDCCVYALALREMLKLRIPRKAEEGEAPAGRRIISKGVRRD